MISLFRLIGAVTRTIADDLEAHCYYDDVDAVGQNRLELLVAHLRDASDLATALELAGRQPATTPAAAPIVLEGGDLFSKGGRTDG